MDSFSEHKLSRVGVHWCYLVARNNLLEANYSFTVYSTLWQYVPVFKSSWEKRIPVYFWISTFYFQLFVMSVSCSSAVVCDVLICADDAQKENLLNCQFQTVFTSKPTPPPLTLKQLCQQKVQGLQESGHYNPDNVLPEAWNIYTSMTDINLSVNGIMKLL